MEGPQLRKEGPNLGEKKKYPELGKAVYHVFNLLNSINSDKVNGNFSLCLSVHICKNLYYLLCKYIYYLTCIYI